MKTEKKLNFGSSGSRGFLRFGKNRSSEEKMEKRRDAMPSPALYVLTNESGLREMWEKMFNPGYVATEILI